MIVRNIYLLNATIYMIYTLRNMIGSRSIYMKAQNKCKQINPLKNKIAISITLDTYDRS